MKKSLVLLMFMAPLFAQAHEAATKCEGQARKAAQGMVEAAATAIGLDLKLDEMTYSNGATYRFSVPSGHQHLGAYEIQVAMDEAVCFPKSVDWTISPRD